jgi:DNA-binding NarL/FixJ family response regulator
MPDSAALRWLSLARRAATATWDDESWETFADLHITLARRSGALGMLPIALTSRAELHLAAGELEAASLLIEEVSAVTAATGHTPPAYGRIGLAAWQGHDNVFTEFAPSTAAAAAERGDGLSDAMVRYWSAVLYNSRGLYRRALAETDSAVADAQNVAYAPWSLSELVEAASRTGESSRAAAALERLAETTQASGSEWALGVEARARALLSADSAAEQFHLEAITRLSNTRVRMELARAHLLYGEWQRRAGRRAHARDSLRTAHGMFSAFGAAAFADRARRELLATGETVRKRTAVSSSDLTAQESQIATLAAAGRTNLEIGAELFISSRTVEWHLAKVYTKLGITSRRELRGAIERRRRSFASQHRLGLAQDLSSAAEASGWS